MRTFIAGTAALFALLSLVGLFAGYWQAGITLVIAVAVFSVAERRLPLPMGDIMSEKDKRE